LDYYRRDEFFKRSRKGKTHNIAFLDEVLELLVGRYLVPEDAEDIPLRVPQVDEV